MPRFLLASLLALTLLSCASPQTSRPNISNDALAQEQRRQSLFVLETRAADFERVYNISERLSRSNAELCSDKTRAIGIRMENLRNYPEDMRAIARDLWGISDQPSINWVGEGTPAQLAGIRERDQILAVNGREIRKGNRSVSQAHDAIRDALRDGPVALQLLRGTENISVSVSPVEVCAYQVVLVDADEVNAAADGNSIILNRGMLRFAESDEELALIIGHELAHNAMGHIDSMKQNAAVGAIAGGVVDVLFALGGVNTNGAFSDAGGDIGRRMFSQDFESEADYVGIYFMARSGYETEGVETFWRRMAAENPEGIRFAYTHPNYAERF
ncbi:MAG: M48 family metallopeptidase, partial [Caulobacterales bacterium]